MIASAGHDILKKVTVANMEEKSGVIESRRSRVGLGGKTELVHNTSKIGSYQVTEGINSVRPTERSKKFEDEFNKFFGPSGIGSKNANINKTFTESKH